MAAHKFQDVSNKQAEFLKKLAQTQFELHLEKETLFTVAWPEKSGIDQAHFDLSEMAREPLDLPNTLRSFLNQSVAFTLRPKLNNLNAFDNNQLRSVKILCINLGREQLASLVDFYCSHGIGCISSQIKVIDEGGQESMGGRDTFLGAEGTENRYSIAQILLQNKDLGTASQITLLNVQISDQQTQEQSSQGEP